MTVAPDAGASARESLRFTARLVQELSARAALELGRRGVSAGRLRRADDIKWLSLDEVEATRGEPVPLEPHPARSHAEPPLPAAFRVTASGAVVAERSAAPGGGGQGAGGGRAMGSVHALEDVEPGDVLVVRTLDPQLAGVLPDLGGLVAETGSVLSHLAILAREFGVATVIGVPDAIDRFPVGSKVLVDGQSGEVSVVSLEEAGHDG
jgi:pyruvate,water dikinase